MTPPRLVSPTVGLIPTTAQWLAGQTIDHDGVRYGQKAHSLRNFLDLPAMTGEQFELALAIDPGETRDLERGQIAIQASLTGHLVFTTLHTNDAPGAITRLIDMGVEPFLISSTLEAVLGQRLLRSICQHCRTTYQPSEPLLAQLGIARIVIHHRQLPSGDVPMRTQDCRQAFRLPSFWHQHVQRHHHPRLGAAFRQDVAPGVNDQ